MPDILYAAALDKQLYANSQLEVATTQATQRENERTTKLQDIVACQTCYNCISQCCQAAWDDCQTCIAQLNAPQATDLQQRIIACPGAVSLWCEIPDKTGDAGWTTFWVCDTSGYKRCGNNCNWTVPSNVICAQFDMWGPGAMSYGHQCCGGSPYGANGTFVSVTMPVCPGETWCMCAGCAYCCYIGGNNEVGDARGIPGFNTSIQSSCTSAITNCYACQCSYQITAPAAQPRSIAYYSWCRGMPVWCRVTFNCAGGTGQCWCNASSYCYSNSCATCCELGGFNTNNYGHGVPNRPCSSMYSVPGQTGWMCLDTNNYGYHRTLGVPRFAYTHANCAHLCHNFSSNTCGGCNCSHAFGNGSMGWPGQGGHSVHTMGGCCGPRGDSGRMGAVRITYYTC